MNSHEEDLKVLKLAEEWANLHSGCLKVSVGSLIEDAEGIFASVGTNITSPGSCKKLGCLRVSLYGDNDKTHRAPSDCRAIHSEIDAIARAASCGTFIHGGTIYVTRYPCEACARAIVAAGIKKVIYGRSQKISDLTDEIFCEGCVKVIHCADFIAYDATN